MELLCCSGTTVRRGLLYEKTAAPSLRKQILFENCYNVNGKTGYALLLVVVKIFNLPWLFDGGRRLLDGDGLGHEDQPGDPHQIPVALLQVSPDVGQRRSGVLTEQGGEWPGHLVSVEEGGLGWPGFQDCDRNVVAENKDWVRYSMFHLHTSINLISFTLNYRLEGKNHVVCLFFVLLFLIILF